MASTEEDAYPIMQSLDVDYVLVIFGGMTGYSSDDINKFLWMVRIGGGVFPHIKVRVHVPAHVAMLVVGCVCCVCALASLGSMLLCTLFPASAVVVKRGCAWIR